MTFELTLSSTIAKGVVDAEVMRIANENLIGSGGLDATETVTGTSADGAD
jgi:hypothetical protein